MLELPDSYRELSSFEVLGNYQVSLRVELPPVPLNDIEQALNLVKLAEDNPLATLANQWNVGDVELATVIDLIPLPLVKKPLQLKYTASQIILERDEQKGLLRMKNHARSPFALTPGQDLFVFNTVTVTRHANGYGYTLEEVSQLYFPDKPRLLPAWAWNKLIDFTKNTTTNSHTEMFNQISERLSHLVEES